MSHARLSPSSAKRWMLCPAAPSREALCPDTTSEVAMAGSNVHAMLESLVLDAPVELPYPDVPVPPELGVMADQCYAYALRRQKELKPAVLKAETKVNPEMFTGRSDGKGTADIILCSNSVLEVIDLKTGGRYVDADDPQFKIYALGALAEYTDPKTGKIPLPLIRLTVFQPKRPASPSQIERYIEITPEELLSWCMEQYIPKAAATDDPNAKGVPNDEACHFCKARHTCPDIVEAMFMSPVNTGSDLLLSNKAIADLTPEELAAFLDIAPLIKARIKDAEERAEAELKDRHLIPGWKLVRGNKRREWEDEARVEEMCKELKIPPGKFAPRKILSPAQMQKLGLKAEKWQQLQTLIVEKPGNLCLAPISDKREDAMPVNLFQPIADDSWLS